MAYSSRFAANSLLEAVAISFAFILLSESVHGKTLTFSGREWSVRSSQTGTSPGPNNWDENNAFLDDQGRLHLKITQRNGRWYCAEVATIQRLGFGRYQFQIEGPIDRLDQNIVLGLFNYPPPDVGPDRTNEIDIEYAKWGYANGKPASFTVYPSVAGRPQTSYQFDLALSGTYTTQSFAWRSNNILFSGQHGHQNNNRLNEYVSWTFAPANAVDVPQSPMPAMINLWLFNGLAPSNGQELEIVIHSFQFTPY
ncbi:beta-glucanase-like [Paramacrobiotus metropolitanus]|uniref:beta-glucanase-like n=1 Tax=Paramacrobiotus metropolitanus TaxID=2943436 RepID=UPI002445C2A5|nr:beta-glucanase-like [Paramacrobiotus metropolitanus]